MNAIEVLTEVETCYFLATLSCTGRFTCHDYHSVSVLSDNHPELSNHGVIPTDIDLYELGLPP